MIALRRSSGVRFRRFPALRIGVDSFISIFLLNAEEVLFDQ
jgi:hypothetical protein